MTWFRMNDAEPDGMYPIAPQEAAKWNAQGFGVFSTVQTFRGRRRIENLDRIRAWAIDLDDGTKEQQRRRIARSPLIPSSIVETKSGYHVYWYALGAHKAFYRALLDRLVAFFGADSNARDLARVLRVPGFLHLKEPDDPFLVRHAYGPFRSRLYAERQMFRFFPAVPGEAKERHEEQRREYVRRGDEGGDNFWESVYNLDCMDALERLSGTGYVGGERYTFKPVSGGRRHNIFVDGKSSPCWIDESGHIGSPSKGGPTVIQWLHWFGTPKSECVRIVKTLYPELAE